MRLIRQQRALRKGWETQITNPTETLPASGDRETPVVAAAQIQALKSTTAELWRRSHNPSTSKKLQLIIVILPLSLINRKDLHWEIRTDVGENGGLRMSKVETGLGASGSICDICAPFKYGVRGKRLGRTKVDGWRTMAVWVNVRE